MGLLRRFLDANVKISQTLNRLLPDSLQADGNQVFLRDFVPDSVSEGDRVYDLGGGSRPFISLDRKRALNLTIIGLDISEEELSAAPDGVYDREIVADLTKFVGDGDGDVVICQAVLEHVRDGAGTMRAISSCLKPGGRAFIFAPCRNAMFARLNLLLPQSVKERLLFTLFPSKAKGHDGFPAFYDKCTPRELEQLADANGLNIEHRRLFWMSSYFTVLAPAFIAWRLIQGANYLFLGDNAAEAYIYVLRKRTPASSGVGLGDAAPSFSS
ncbi:class I SAM-dependent methyltransferase [Sphingomonas sp. ST-64]|uniref:Class I SAM-dependent methyltransferase n=1 Tax=Sphingomonas plantiphila TaxID=3163295 RepID=A0ABW8YI58_9SPHN